MNALTLRKSTFGFMMLIPGVASAHHPMGGETPDTLWHGLLSGLAHPFIGVAHLVFIFAAAVLLLTLGKKPLPKMGVFLLATLAGAAWQLVHWPMTFAHSLLALSVLAAGLLLTFRQQAATLVMLLMCVSGLIHGFVYAEAVIGARTGPVATYLVGFTLVQGVMLSAFYHLGLALKEKLPPEVFLRCRRAGGVLLATLGVLLLST